MCGGSGGVLRRVPNTRRGVANASDRGVVAVSTHTSWPTGAAKMLECMGIRLP